MDTPRFFPAGGCDVALVDFVGWLLYVAGLAGSLLSRSVLRVSVASPVRCGLPLGKLSPSSCL
jgi:hypothetical protein